MQPLARNVWVTDSELTVELADGRRVSAPLVWFPRLRASSAADRRNWVLLGDGDGIHWPAIDEDLSVASLVAGTRSRSQPLNEQHRTSSASESRTREVVAVVKGAKSSSLPFTVLVDDNYHYMDESKRGTLGSFATYELAVARAKGCVDGFLESTFEPGMSAARLYGTYKQFGEDPFIVCDEPQGESFSAWDYAKARCEEICASEAT